MGAYRAGADPQLDQAIAMHDALTQFLGQPARSTVSLTDSVAALESLFGHVA